MELNGRMIQHQLIARSAAAGSMVLLRNVQNTLPLVPPGTEPLSVALFGVGQVHTVNTCDVNGWGKSNIQSALKQAETIKIDGLLSRKYETHLQSTMEEMPVASLSMEEFASENHAAIVVISRNHGPYDVNLSMTEQNLINVVTSKFDRSILILNTPGYMNVAEIASKFGAVVFMGIAGQEGGKALADLLTGETEFSGRLATSWPLSPTGFLGGSTFVGYGKFNSSSEPMLYPFGYGLGYGNCVLESYAMALDGWDIAVEATFANVGETFPARQVLQIYFTTPVKHRQTYTLDGFVKTKLLMPGDSQTVSHRFPVWELSRYDQDKEAFVLDAGHYDIRMGTDSRTTFVAGSIFVPKDIMAKQVKSMGEPSGVELAENPFTYPEEAEELSSARSRAIRLPMRQMKRKSVSYGKPFAPCTGGEPGLTFRNSEHLEALVASMADSHLETILKGEACEEFQVPAVTSVSGVGGLAMAKTIRDDEGNITFRRYLTAFPVPSLLACSFDHDLIAAVGQAIGKEAKEYGCHIYTGITAELCNDPSLGNCALWSEDPVVAGLCAGWLIGGCQSYTMAALCGGDLSKSEIADRHTHWLSYEIAINVAKPRVYSGCLPLELLKKEWKFRGAHYHDGDRLEMEQSVLSLLALMRYAKF